MVEIEQSYLPLGKQLAANGKAPDLIGVSVYRLKPPSI